MWITIAPFVTQVASLTCWNVDYQELMMPYAPFAHLSGLMSHVAKAQNQRGFSGWQKH
ncbi:hypothetical protein ECDEC2B_5333 [Escherichia coli DEC2B]|nr:hypothetical protein EC236275_3023 [Escherichia coli 2362-75]EHU09773.1 hypothetical protein ECDEC1A_2194 [Escherichia coli DEC1A]EHU13519.1 hypothetical protein ECDEC1B_2366 [Escherichia coli DEC1B]EHU16853.1 hypothetical protein ECDEC1C_5454 [Escherichia coli DEC1C]EHU22985.1 hypothetical protein ECDEC1D_2685 [Escherichia coli DEC1D]EHU33385.1 hypothetical protein ECDEC2B_5333 [Escherichia coli DEC2B]EHU34462.1 hypothetical protein ECDEC2C_5499 [Escherichia coli DEC2C]EHU34629.1 hypothe